MRLLMILTLSASAALAQYYPPGGGGGGGSPTGAAGGALTGTYPNPGVAGFSAGAGTLTGPATNLTIVPFVNMQSTTPGTAQTGNSNINGVGIFGNTTVPNNLNGTLGTAALSAASAFQPALTNYSTISGLTGYPSTFPPINSGDWAGTWQTHAPAYFQPALANYSTISGLTGYPTSFPAAGFTAGAGTLTGPATNLTIVPFVNLQSTTPGTPQTGNMNISGAGIFGGTVSVGTTVPIGAPANSVAAAGNGYFRNLTFDNTLGNFFTGASGTNWKTPPSLGTTITGSGNTGTGRALWNLSSGYSNAGHGLDALGFTTTGYFNSGFGTDALGWNSTGHSNSGFGGNSLWSNTIGRDNTAAGYFSGFSVTAGVSNTFIGDSADFLNPNLTSTTFTPSIGSGLSVGYYFYAISFLLNGPGGSPSETALSSGGYFGINTTTGNQQIAIAVIPTYSGPLTCTGRKIYRTVASLAGPNGPARRWYLVTTLADNTTTAYTDSTPDASLVTEESGLPSYSIALGLQAQPWKSDQMAVGSYAAPITEIWLGQGPIGQTAQITKMFASGTAGTNAGGSALQIGGGPGTGSGANGYLSLMGYSSGSSGAYANALVERYHLNPNGSLCGGAGVSASINPCPYTVPLTLYSDQSAGAVYQPTMFQNYSSSAGSAVGIPIANSGSTTTNGSGSAELLFTRQSDGSTQFDLLLAPGGAVTQASALSLPGNVTLANRANMVVCWKSDGKTFGYATVAEITAGTCH